MTDWKSLFLILTKAGFLGETLDESVVGEIDEKNLISVHAVAKMQGLAHIVAMALIKNSVLPGSEILGKFRDELRVAVFKYERLSTELENICNLFEKNGIAHIPLKGAVMWQHYPEPWMRTSCDIDVLVKGCDLERASDLLVQTLEYTLLEKLSHDWTFCTPDGFHIELHFRLIEQDVASDGIVKHTWTSACLEDVWDHATLEENKAFKYRMDDESFYFYHIAHMAKHFERGSCGARSLIDLWILNHNGKNDRTKGLLEKNGLLQFTNVMTTISEDWLNVGDIPRGLEHVFEYILRGGAYGTPTNSVAVRRSKTTGKFRYFLSMVFLPYYSMKLQYPILEKHKYLLPLCYLSRIFRTVFFRRYKLSRSIKNISSLSEEKLLKTQKMLSDLGLF